MLVETLIYLFAVLYYVFSTFVFVAYISNENFSHLKAVILAFLTIIVAPIFVPIIVGVKVGDGMKKENRL